MDPGTGLGAWLGGTARAFAPLAITLGALVAGPIYALCPDSGVDVFESDMNLNVDAPGLGPRQSYSRARLPSCAVSPASRTAKT
jgi:hypothetical protein